MSEDQLHFPWQAQHFGDLHRHFAWQAQHFRRVALRVLRIALLSEHVSSRFSGLLVTSLCLGRCCKTFHFRRFKRDCNVILRGRRVTWGHVKLFHNVSKIVLCDRCNTFASLSEDELHFLWQARRFGDLHRHFAWQVQHIRRVVLKCCVFFANRNVRAASSGVNAQIPRQAWGTVRVSCCGAGAGFGEDPQCVECYFAWQALYLGHSRH